MKGVFSLLYNVASFFGHLSWDNDHVYCKSNTKRVLRVWIGGVWPKRCQIVSKRNTLKRRE